MKLLLGSLVGLALLLPLGQGANPLCADPCRIGATSEGYLPPVAVLATGTNVSWEELDGVPHVNGDAGFSDPCLFVPIEVGTPSENVRFDISAGQLELTTQPGTANATTIPCGNGVALADGSFALPYFCLLHPLLMRGALVVRPA